MSKHEPNERFAEPSNGSDGTNGSGAVRDRRGAGGSGIDLTARYGAASSKGSSANGDLNLSDVIERLRSLLAIVRNRWMTGLAASILVVGVFAFMFLKSEPEHTAVSTMLAQSSLDELLPSNVGVRGDKSTYQENFLQNHLSVMQSRRFSVALAGEFTDEEREIIVTPYMDPIYDPSTAPMAFFEQILAKRMGATRQRDREFFTLSFHHIDPDIAVMVADRMTATYLKLVQDEIREANLAAAEILEEQAKQLQAEINLLEEEQRGFREMHNIVSVQEDHGLLAERLRRIDENRYDARIERFRLESLFKDAKRDMAAEELPFYNPLLANFANNQELRQELDSLTAQRKVMALRYGRNHPKMQDIDGQINGARENLKRNFDLAFRDLENQYENLMAIEQQLESEFKEEFGEGIENGRLANQFQVIGNEVGAKKETLNDLLRRVSSAVVMSNLPADVMRVVDPAFVVKPKLATRKLALVFAVLLGGGAFFGVPLFQHLFDQRLKCATDIEKELGKDLIGGVPGMSRNRTKDRPHVVRDNLDPSKTEPFMGIVAQIELLSHQRGQKSFVVTSTSTGEGKSTISSNLAAGFTQIGRKTLIVDGDLRRPSQHQFNRIKKDGGLLRWAEAGYPTEDLFGEDSPLGIQKIANGSYLLPTGGIYPHPAQFLVSSHFDTLFQLLKECFDIIIVDTPPVGLYPDALVLAQLVGETILIAREAKAPVSQIRQVIADIDNTAAPVLGVVLNDYSPGSLNPRLAFSGGDKGYGYFTNNSENEKATAAAKTMVGRLMADAGNEKAETATKTPAAKFTAAAKIRSKGKPAPKTLIGKLMADEK